MFTLSPAPIREFLKALDDKWRGRSQRLATAFATAALSAFWIGPFWAIAWLSAVLAYQGVLAPRLAARFADRFSESDPPRYRRNRTILIFIGSCFYVAGWAPAYFTGGDGAAWFAGVWVSATLIHALIYLSEDRAYLAASTGPHILAALAGPFLASDSMLLALVLALATARLGFTLFIAHRDRQVLTNQAVDNRVRRQQAEDASAAKSQFLATMSHELRTPLNAIIGYAEILEEDLADEDNEASAKDAARIRRSARELLTLINEVLDFSKIEAGRIQLQPAPADIDEMLRSVAEEIRPLAKANNSLVELEASAIGVQEIDALRLRQCVLHLTANACKFTMDGHIRISAGVTHDRAGAHLAVRIADTGRGISEADQARLFQPFLQADGALDRANEGAGLGLAITRRLARLMGGDVSCESVIGEGSTFTLAISLPRAAEADVGAGPLVLVIDDQAEARELTRRAVARLPFRVRGASSATEGVALAHAETPALIVLDIHLPDRSGWDVLADFRDVPALKDTPILVCSIEEDRARAIALGACDHLTKPVDRDRLAAAIVLYARRPNALISSPAPSQSARLNAS